MITEFIGLPGVGKSYLAAQEADQNNIPLVIISSKRERFWFGSLFLLRYPRIGFSFLVQNCRGVQSVCLCKHKAFFLVFSAMAKEYKARRYVSCIIDEGMYQLLFSLYERKVSSGEFQKYIRMLTKKLPKRQLYFVETEEGVRMGRMQQRNRLPRSGFGVTYAKETQNVMKENSSVIKCALQPVISKTLDN